MKKWLAKTTLKNEKKEVNKCINFNNIEKARKRTLIEKNLLLYFCFEKWRKYIYRISLHIDVHRVKEK